MDVYGFFKDQGSAVGGGVTLIAGVLAYLAGMVQANATKSAASRQIAAANQAALDQVAATRQAAADQVAAAEQQLLQAHQREREADDRRRNGLLMALSMEASRTKMLLVLRKQMLHRMWPSMSNEIIPARAAAIYAVEMMVELRHNPDLDALLAEAVALGARELIASIDQLNASVDFKGPIAELHDRELDDLLTKAWTAANELEKSVSLELDRHRPGTLLPFLEP